MECNASKLHLNGLDIVSEQSNQFTEPSKKELMQLLKELPAGYSLRFSPFILPVSLKEYRLLFLDNEAPNFHTSFLSENGSELIWLEDWFDWTTTEGFKDHDVYERYRRIHD
jgi:hypothetical protein